MSEELVEIYRGGGGPPHAAIIHSVLEDAGIESSVQSGGLSAAYPVTVGALGEFSVWVRATDAADAAEVLKAATEEPPPQSS